MLKSGTISSCSIRNRTDVDPQTIEQENSGIACRLNSCEGRRLLVRRGKMRSPGISQRTMEGELYVLNRITDLIKPASCGFRSQPQDAKLSIRSFHHWHDRRSHWYSPMINSDKPISTSNNNQHTWKAGQDVEVFFNSYWCGMTQRNLASAFFHRELIGSLALALLAAQPTFCKERFSRHFAVA